VTGSGSNGERSAPSSTGTVCRCAAAAAQVDDAIHLYSLGWSLARVGDHLGVNHTTVLNKLRERGVPTRDTHGRPRVEAGGAR
jgi:hypothetical protein